MAGGACGSTAMSGYGPDAAESRCEKCPIGRLTAAFTPNRINVTFSSPPPSILDQKRQQSGLFIFTSFRNLRLHGPALVFIHVSARSGLFML
jgi:hypothetical protein